MVIVIMGVAGAGKTTVGHLLAEALGAEFAEGDAYHPPENVAKMKSGTPLQDADRWPWLEAMSREIGHWLETGRPVVLACSALKQRYRDVLRGGRSGVRFVYLKGDRPLIGERLGARRGHFMPPSLLVSQFEALEEPADAIVVDVTAPPEALAQRILAELGRVEA